MEQNVTRLVLSEIKLAMKKAKLTYVDVAKALRMSESGFKKLMNGKDCSLTKLEKICQIVGLRVSDLFRSVEGKDLKEVAFSPSQEDYFEKNPKGFLLYWMLAYERRNLTESLAILGLDEKNGFSILRKLDALGLLKIGVGNRLTLPQPKGIRWIGNSKFIIDLYRRWGTALLEDSLERLSKRSPKPASDHYFAIRYFKMSESTWKEFLIALTNLELEYANRATAEMRLNITELGHVRWVTAVDNRSWAMG